MHLKVLKAKNNLVCKNCSVSKDMIDSQKLEKSDALGSTVGLTNVDGFAIFYSVI